VVTGLILAERSEALAVTLSALVPGVADGVIADAVVIALRPSEGVVAIAEAAGASLVQPDAGASPWMAGAGLARRDWLLCLKDGDAFSAGWIETVDRFVSRAGQRRLASFRHRPASAGASVRAGFEALVGAASPRAGLLLHRGILTESGRFAGRTRPVRLQVRIERSLA
jgi:hypothetical protein